MKTQITTNQEKDLLKNLKKQKQKYLEFMIQSWMKKLKNKIESSRNHKDL